MSAVATFYVLSRASVAELARVATECEAATVRGMVPFHQAMVEHAREVGDYGWSGSCMTRLLRFVRWRGVTLPTRPYRAQAKAINRVYDCTLLTGRPSRWSLARLDPARYREPTLARSRFLRIPDFEEAGAAAMDGLNLLHRELSTLRADEVFMVHVA